MDGYSGENGRQRNVIGGFLASCSERPMTDFIAPDVATLVLKMPDHIPFVLL